LFSDVQQDLAEVEVVVKNTISDLETGFNNTNVAVTNLEIGFNNTSVAVGNLEIGINNLESTLGKTNQGKMLSNFFICC
jgi:hypothetical protein